MKKKHINYKLMLQDINDLVDNDWGLNINRNLTIEQKFTHKEAMEMAEVIISIYRISHSWNGCCLQDKYEVSESVRGRSERK